MTGASGRPGSAGATIVAAVAAIALQHADASAGAARDEPEAVHRARTLTRRLRSVLGANRELFEQAPLRAVRDGLEEFGDALGRVRDLEVRLEQAETRLKQAETRLDDGAAAALRRRLLDEVRARHAARLNRLSDFLDGRGHEVQHAVAGFVAAPPFAPAAAGEAEATLSAVLIAEAKRIGRAVRSAAGEVESLHRLRRAVRRLRYTAEAVSSPPIEVFGAEVREMAERAQRVQDRLGAHRDELLFAEQLRAIEAVARDAGEETGGYEALAADAFAAAAGRLEGLGDELHELRRSMRRLRGLAGAD